MHMNICIHTCWCILLCRYMEARVDRVSSFIARLLSFETGSPTGPGAHIAANWPAKELQGSSRLYSLTPRVRFIDTCRHTLMEVTGSKFRPLCISRTLVTSWTKAISPNWFLFPPEREVNSCEGSFQDVQGPSWCGIVLYGRTQRAAETRQMLNANQVLDLINTRGRLKTKASFSVSIFSDTNSSPTCMFRPIWLEN